MKGAGSRNNTRITTYVDQPVVNFMSHQKMKERNRLSRLEQRPHFSRSGQSLSSHW